MSIFHYLSNLFNPFIFSRPIFFFFHLILIQWLQMINIQEALQIREKWQIFYYLLSSRRKIAQDKIAHFCIIQKQFGKSISSSLFLFFLSQHILTFLVYFTKFRLFDGCYPIGALGGWNVFIYKQVQEYKSLFLPKALFPFPK